MRRACVRACVRVCVCERERERERERHSTVYMHMSWNLPPFIVVDFREGQTLYSSPRPAWLLGLIHKNAWNLFSTVTCTFMT